MEGREQKDFECDKNQIECWYEHMHKEHTLSHLIPQKHISCHTHLACFQTRRDGD